MRWEGGWGDIGVSLKAVAEIRSNCINSSSSTIRFIHINEYEYMNNYVQYIIVRTRDPNWINDVRENIKLINF